MRSTPAIVLAALLAGATGVSRADVPNDCGIVSLYYLMRLQGLDVPEVEVRQALRATEARGASMLDLKRTARGFGLSLSGVKLGRGAVAVAGPALCFLAREGGGHFIVVRPVGHSGRLFQLLDGYDEPRVLEVEELTDLPGWTGLALVPDRGEWIAPAALGLAAIGAAGLALIARAPWRPRAD